MGISSFSFVVMTYNHEDFIVEHLESIKYLVQNYADHIDVDLIISDDCSKDNTVNLIGQWLEKNGHIFRNYKLIRRRKNVGLVKSMFQTIQWVKTDYMKFIAGDDKFNKNNLFEQYAGMGDKIILSPVETFGAQNEVSKMIRDNFDFVRGLQKTDRIKKYLRYDNFISSPGAFVPIGYYKDPRLWKELLRYKLIEDYPGWFYILYKKRADIEIINKPYVCYRIGSGVSTKDVPSAFAEDLKQIRNRYKLRIGRIPNKINPFFYYFYAIRLWVIYKIRKHDQG